MKKSFNFLNILLLAFVILIGSIVEVYSHPAIAIDTQSLEITKDVEDFSDLTFSHNIKILHSFFYIELPTSVFLSEENSSQNSTVPQLLCSYRIALPPPHIKLV